jgi:hypothetical protein
VLRPSCSWLPPALRSVEPVRQLAVICDGTGPARKRDVLLRRREAVRKGCEETHLKVSSSLALVPSPSF